MSKDDIKINSQIEPENDQKIDENTDQEIDENTTEDNDKKVIEELKKKISELENLILREKAENENIRKRFIKELEDAHKYAISGFTRDLIDGLENLYRAVESMASLITDNNEQVKNLYDGISMTKKTLLTAFEKNGVMRIYPLNELFDHNYHQAISQIEDNERQNNTVVQVIRAGYKIKDRLLQPALVTVSKKS